MTLLQLLHNGRIEEFNAKRGQRVTLDFFAVDFSECELAGVDLSGATLEKGDLSQADLTGARLDRANLSGADLTGAKLDRCIAVKTRFREACLEGASLAGGEFAGADFSDAELTNVAAARVRMSNARLKCVSARHADLSGADLTDARLVEADLRDADLTGANLTGADLSRADLTGAKLQGATLKSAKLAGAKLVNADLQRALVAEADLSGADLSGAEIAGADFSKADLFDIQGEPELLARVRGGPATPEPSPVAVINVQIDQAGVVESGGALACLWDNTPEEEEEDMIICVSLLGAAPPVLLALPLPADQVLVRALLPAPDGFRVVALLDNPGGVVLWTATLSRSGALVVQENMRLGYTPVVQPVFEAEAGSDGFLVYGIGRQSVLSVHRYSPAGIAAGAGGLQEVLRAPAQTYRGFCGQLDPILLGKGGTLATVAPDGIGRLQPAPAGYPGRLTAAAADPSGRIAVAWAGRDERGLRFQIVGEGEAVRIDPKLEIGAIALLCHGGRWLLCWTREAVRGGEATVPVGQWMPDGKPFLLLDPVKVGAAAKEEIVEIRPVSGPTPMLAFQTFLDALVVVEVEGEGTKVRATLK